MGLQSTNIRVRPCSSVSIRGHIFTPSPPCVTSPCCNGHGSPRVEVTRGIGHPGSSECAPARLALRATATMPRAIEQATPGTAPIDACRLRTPDDFAFFQIVQWCRDVEARHQRCRELRECIQELRLAPRPMFLIVAIQREQDATHSEVLGQINRQSQHGQVPLRQRHMTHPLRRSTEITA